MKISITRSARCRAPEGKKTFVSLIREGETPVLEGIPLRMTSLKLYTSLDFA